MLAVQGPRSRTVLSALMPEAESLAYFDHVPAKVAGAAVTLSRTGYTGDLGFELTVPADARGRRARRRARGRPRPQHPAVRRGGADDAAHRGRPRRWSTSSGTTAGSRSPTRERVTPKELGCGWMLRGVRDGVAPLRRRARRSGASWSTARRAGRRPASSSTGRTGTGCTATPGCCRRSGSTRCRTSRCCYDDDRDEVGYCTSFVYSPVLQRHIGIARVRPDLAAPGTELHLELALAHHNTTVPVAHHEDAVLQPREEDVDAMTSSHDYDAIVVGGGHNGLTHAAYLGQGRPAHAGARAERRGRRRRDHRGAACPASRSRRSPTR